MLPKSLNDGWNDGAKESTIECPIIFNESSSRHTKQHNRMHRESPLCLPDFSKPHAGFRLVRPISSANEQAQEPTCSSLPVPFASSRGIAFWESLPYYVFKCSNFIGIHFILLIPSDGTTLRTPGVRPPSITMVISCKL